MIILTIVNEALLQEQHLFAAWAWSLPLPPSLNSLLVHFHLYVFYLCVYSFFSYCKNQQEAGIKMSNVKKMSNDYAYFSHIIKKPIQFLFLAVFLIIHSLKRTSCIIFCSPHLILHGVGSVKNMWRWCDKWINLKVWNMHV